MGHTSINVRKSPQKNEMWYDNYKTLRQALASIPEASDNTVHKKGGAGSDGNYGMISDKDVRRDYPESLKLTPAVSESVSTLIRATEQLLLSPVGDRAAAAAPVGGSGGSLQENNHLVEVETCRKVNRRTILRCIE